TLTVVGRSVVGLEYASMAAALGVRVALVDERPRLLELVDDELVECLVYHLRGLGLVFHLGEKAESVRRLDTGAALTLLAGGKELHSDAVVYAAGRRGATGRLRLSAAGLEADQCGRVAVGRDYRTAQPHVFAAGDVIGSPGLAATAAAQGRLAALAAFDR